MRYLKIGHRPAVYNLGNKQFVRKIISNTGNKQNNYKWSQYSLCLYESSINKTIPLPLHHSFVNDAASTFKIISFGYCTISQMQLSVFGYALPMVRVTQPESNTLKTEFQAIFSLCAILFFQSFFFLVVDSYPSYFVQPVLLIFFNMNLLEEHKGTVCMKSPCIVIKQ